MRRMRDGSQLLGCRKDCGPQKICALISAGICLSAAGDSSDEQAVRDVFAAFSASWNQPGMPGFGDLFTEDADFVVISGNPHDANTITSESTIQELLCCNSKKQPNT
jgi:hypothetical protein